MTKNLLEKISNSQKYPNYAIIGKLDVGISTAHAMHRQAMSSNAVRNFMSSITSQKYS